jgi:hypothetical protein
MQAAVLSGAIPSISVEQWALDPDRFLEVTWKLRGWSWVDPTKEVEAYKEAIKAGLTTTTRVIAQTADGADIEDIIAERKRELEMFDEAGIEIDTTVQEPVEPVAPAAPAPPAPPAPPKPGAEDNTQDEVKSALRALQLDAEMRGERVGREDALAEAMAGIGRAITRHAPATINVAPAAVTITPPVVNVAPPQVAVAAPVIHVAAARVTVPPTVVNVAAAKAPVVNVAAAEAPVVNVAAPTVNVEPAQVRVTPTIEVKVPEAKRAKRVRTVTAWTADGMPKTVEETDG